MTKIQFIKQKVINKEYYLSSHAEDEMLEDALDRGDIENAIFKGRIERRLTQDIRGTRYKIMGCAKDGRQMHVICRFKEGSDLIIITVYAVRKDEYDL